MILHVEYPKDIIKKKKKYWNSSINLVKFQDTTLVYRNQLGISLVIQGLGLHTSIAGVAGN